MRSKTSRFSYFSDLQIETLRCRNLRRKRLHSKFQRNIVNVYFNHNYGPTFMQAKFGGVELNVHY